MSREREGEERERGRRPVSPCNRGRSNQEKKLPQHLIISLTLNFPNLMEEI